MQRRWSAKSEPYSLFFVCVRACVRASIVELSAHRQRYSVVRIRKWIFSWLSFLTFAYYHHLDYLDRQKLSRGYYDFHPRPPELRTIDLCCQGSIRGLSLLPFIARASLLSRTSESDREHLTGTQKNNLLWIAAFVAQDKISSRPASLVTGLTTPEGGLWGCQTFSPGLPPPKLLLPFPKPSEVKCSSCSTLELLVTSSALFFVQ